MPPRGALLVLVFLVAAPTFAAIRAGIAARVGGHGALAAAPVRLARASPRERLTCCMPMGATNAYKARVYMQARACKIGRKQAMGARMGVCKLAGASERKL